METQGQDASKPQDQHKYYLLPKLPYASDALEPEMSAETLEYHYGKHHKGYVDKLNALIIGSGLEGQPLEEVIRQADGPLFNNAAQAWNHTFFWNCLAPRARAEGRGELARSIEASFGSLDAFKSEFSKKAEELFGSGWVWLAKDEKGKLVICPTGNGDNPLLANLEPLLACDVWEHAYYIDYRNSRQDFLRHFWKIVHWEFVEERFRGQTH
jgi:Fe-Mn family superoxide dismutase